MRAGPADDYASCGGYCVAPGTECCSDADYSSGYVPCCNSTGGFVACTSGYDCVPDYIDTYSSCCAISLLVTKSALACRFVLHTYHPVFVVFEVIQPVHPSMEPLNPHPKARVDPPTIAQVVQLAGQ
jgi:hypothetical protein